MQIDHINIKAPKKLLEIEKDFLLKTLNLTIGKRPNLNHFGYWLNFDNNALFHLSVDENRKSGINNLDHIAFFSDNLQSFMQNLQNLKVEFSYRYIDELNLSQVFFFTTLGVRIEVGFAGK